MSFITARNAEDLLPHRRAQRPIILPQGSPGLTIEVILWHTVPNPRSPQNRIVFRVQHART
jgi:hypothetical protein